MPSSGALSCLRSRAAGPNGPRHLDGLLPGQPGGHALVPERLRCPRAEERSDRDDPQGGDAPGLPAPWEVPRTPLGRPRHEARRSPVPRGRGRGSLAHSSPG
eukprot:5620701-Alexandrium_andersonii.AAC.1